VKRIPVHVVTGAPGSGMNAMVARLLAEREAWAALAPRACPCCVGRVELQVTLARLLRDRRADRILVVLVDREHLKMLERVLAEWPLGQYVAAARSLVLPADEHVSPAELEAS
jgi:hypothetical protein